MLTAALSSLTRDDRRAVAAVAVDRAGPAPEVASVNADPDRLFEIGSVTKALTGLLLADMISRGEVTLETPVGELLPRCAGKALESVTLRELCTHTSGLPRLPHSPALFGRVILGQLVGTDPYGNPSVDSVLDCAARQSLHGAGTFRYSNLGGAVVGQALVAAAARAGRGAPATDYAALLAQRVLEPLGMTTAAVAVPGHSAERGWSATGRRQQPWLLGGYAPAGGVVATIGDMARLAARLLDGSAPGIAALDPLDPASRDGRASPAGETRQSGMFWVVDPGPVGSGPVGSGPVGSGPVGSGPVGSGPVGSGPVGSGPVGSGPVGSGPVTWHNGMTGGYSAIIRIRRSAGTAVVVLSEVADGARVSALAQDLEKSLLGGAQLGGAKLGGAYFGTAEFGAESGGAWFGIAAFGPERGGAWFETAELGAECAGAECAGVEFGGVQVSGVEVSGVEFGSPAPEAPCLEHGPAVPTAGPSIG